MVREKGHFRRVSGYEAEGQIGSQYEVKCGDIKRVGEPGLFAASAQSQTSADATGQQKGKR